MTFFTFFDNLLLMSYEFDPKKIYKDYFKLVKAFVWKLYKRGRIEWSKLDDAENAILITIFELLPKFDKRCSEKTYICNIIYKWSWPYLKKYGVLKETITEDQLKNWHAPHNIKLAADMDDTDQHITDSFSAGDAVEENIPSDRDEEIDAEAPKLIKQRKNKKIFIKKLSLTTKEGKQIDLKDIETEKSLSEFVAKDKVDNILKQLDDAISNAPNNRVRKARKLQKKIFQFAYEKTVNKGDYPSEEEICKALNITRENYQYHKEQIRKLCKWLHD